MLLTTIRPLIALRHARFYSSSHTPSPPLPYRIPRNTRGSVPVYTDYAHGGSRYQVLIRNVEGNVDALADDLARTLFPTGSNEAARVSVQTVRQRHLVLTGGRWKNDVIRWLAQRGF